jgi:glutamate-1-semialdehyde 2,1-aminomutase
MKNGRRNTMGNNHIAIPKCLEMQARAKNIIPGMTQLLSKRPDMFSLGVWPGYYEKAKGVSIWDLDGNHYIDMSIAGIGANVLGYTDPDVDNAVLDAVRKGTSTSLNCPEEVELAELLCEIHPWADMVRYARTGGESMSIAVRIARAYTGKEKIALCGYHGWHDWYLAANVNSKNALGEHHIPGLDPRGVPKSLAGTTFPFRYNHIEELEAIVKTYGKDIAAIIMEPIRNDNPQSGFFKRIREIADETQAVFIIDEISSGFRLNTGGAHLVIMEEKPDIAVFSKGIGNGYPIGAIIGREKIMQAAQKTFISSTYWTERIGPTAALATIKKYKKLDASVHLISIGKQIQAGWREFAVKYSLSLTIGGIPPLSHFTFDYPQAQAIKALFIQLMLDKGFLASTLFYSMYPHSVKHVRSYLKAVDESFAAIAAAIKENNVEKIIKGKPSSIGFKRLN